MTTKLPKLVRDRIPEIIKKQGQVARYRELTGGEKIQALHMKIMEEYSEFLNNPNADEIADLLEVVLTLAREECGMTEKDALDAMHQKRLERGGFARLLFLEEVL